MKKLLLGFAALLAVLVVAIVGVASTQPDTYHVERSVTLAAAPADVFPYINDYQKWFLWNPWQHVDPNMKSAVSENSAGVGAWNTWEGNKDAGKGKMTILESVPDQKTVHDLHFIEPFEDHAKVIFALSASGEQTTLNWSMDGNMNIVSKVMCLFTPMDGMIGPDYERGLKTLKPLVEADAKARKEAEAQKAAADAAAAAAVAAPTGATVPTPTPVIP